MIRSVAMMPDWCLIRHESVKVMNLSRLNCQTQITPFMQGEEAEATLCNIPSAMVSTKFAGGLRELDPNHVSRVGAIGRFWKEDPKALGNYL